jgi:hypothetical protein
MLILNELTEALGLKLPITLVVRTRRNKTCDAYYLPIHSDRTAKLIGHKIVIYTKDVTRDFNTLLAHELIHAWQEENRKAETHGKHFKKLAKQLESQFGFTEIYIKGIDEK